MDDSHDTSDDRYLCGWRVRSEIPLPALARWTDGARPPDLRVRAGQVAEPSDDPSAPLVHVDADGRCVIAIPGVCRYAVDAGGTEAMVQAAGDTASPDVATFLLTTVLAVVAHRRGLLPLQACGLRLGDRVVAVAGRTGSGKSTLAAALVARGATVLADDVVVIDLGSPAVMVRPSHPGLRLWRDALDRLDVTPEGLTRSRAGLEKYHLPTRGFASAAVPLHAVYHLERVAHPRHSGVRQLAGAEGLATAASRVWLRGPSLTRLGRAGFVLPAAGRVAAAPGGSWLINSLHTPAGLARAADAVWELTRG